MKTSNRWVKNAIRMGCVALVASSLFWLGCADLSQNMDDGFRAAFGGVNQQGYWQPGAFSTPIIIPAN